MDQFAKETLPISFEDEMRRSYLDYAMNNTGNSRTAHAIDSTTGQHYGEIRAGLKPPHPNRQ